MPPWTTFAINPQAIDSLYLNTPTLESVDIVKLSLSRDGPNISVQFLISLIPDKVPSKWCLKNLRGVSIALDLVGVAGFKLNGWATTIKGSLEFSRKSNSGLFAEFKSSDVQMEVACDFLRIASVSGVNY